jgi:hypothetical protein
MSIRLFNNSGGYIDLNAGGDGTAANVFTLPAETGTLLTSASSLDAITLTGNVAASRIITALNATGSAPFYACRAWVNFNGMNTVAIRASGNVSSITDNGAGDYTVNFATAMPDVNYSMCVGNGSFNDNVNDNNIVLIAPRRGTVDPLTTSGARINTAFRAVGNTAQFDDPGIATLAFFR